MDEREFEKLVGRMELAAEEFPHRKAMPVQDFADQLKQLRLRLGLSVDEFCERYNIPTEIIITAELSRGVKPSTALRLLISMISHDPVRVAALAQVHKKGESGG